MTNAALTAWLAGVHLRQNGLPLPDDLPFEGEGYWIRRGYSDPIDR